MGVVYAMGRGMANWGNIRLTPFVWIPVHQFTAGTKIANPYRLNVKERRLCARNADYPPI